MRRQRGGVFVFTLITLATLVAILAGVVSVRRVELRALANRTAAIRAEHLANSGIQRCLSVLQDQLITGQVPWTDADTWARFGEDGSQNFLYENGSIRLQIVDASGFVNLNTAQQSQLERLPLTVDQIEALLDWREPGFVARPNGAKDDYYNQLPNPYNARLGPMQSVDELLLVRGFAPTTLYSPPTNLQTTAAQLINERGEEAVLAELVTIGSRSANLAADGQTKLNVNTATTQALVARGIPAQTAMQIIQRRNTQGTFVRLGEVLLIPGINAQSARAIIDNLTVSAGTEIEGQVNINTASEAVLNTLPGITPDIASNIFQQQTSGFTSVGALLDIPGINLITLADIVDGLTVNTRTFVIRALGQHGPIRIAVEASIRIIDDTPRITSIRRLPPTRAVWLWGWADEATNDVEFGGIS